MIKLLKLSNIRIPDTILSKKKKSFVQNISTKFNTKYAHFWKNQNWTNF